MTPYTDRELMDLVVGGMRLGDMSAITFLGWLSKKINGAPSYSADTVELVRAVQGVPMGRSMPDEGKIRLLRKLEALNIPIV